MKQNQAIALVAGKKTKIQKLLTSIHHGWNKDRIFGVSRSYQPLDDDGEMFPPENRLVQVKVEDVLKEATKELTGFFDVISTQEHGNTEATADLLAADGTVLVSNVPVTMLLFLEKQLIDIHTLVSKIPTLPTDKVWIKDEAKNCWVTEPEKTVKTQKKIEVIVKYDATPEHPAQTDLVNVDKTIGHWSTIHMSGAIPEERRKEMVSRVEALQASVKIAREEANSLEVQDRHDFGASIISYIFKS